MTWTCSLPFLKLSEYSMELGRQQMQCALQNHTYFLWIKIIFVDQMMLSMADEISA